MTYTTEEILAHEAPRPPLLTTVEAATRCGYRTRSGVMKAFARGELFPVGTGDGCGWLWSQEDISVFLAGRPPGWPDTRRYPEVCRKFGVIYAVEAIGVGHLKLGWTRGNPYLRLSALKTGSAVDLQLVATKRGFQHDEYALHKQLVASRSRSSGEWFRQTEEVKSLITSRGWRPIEGARSAS